ncbi:mitochondrial amino-acid acetyltransferase [Athelia psychrophila]|uniref:Amino-acid acetyltransferase, mitochondrial n=1 Tax=Athelia psychrophila TaxID=1759441 RepID=A0A165ZG87_9AGAM|nr:mitochondrial amino-acid acetyltransferase [Fibularhizoctonia sp. CBS 109695]
MNPSRPTIQDFILSILKAGPSLRDSRSYLEFFGPRARKGPSLVPDATKDAQERTLIPQQAGQTKDTRAMEATTRQAQPSAVAASILNPVYRRTALVKVQGPFNDKQLDSIARGIVYLEKLGLTSVIVVDNDQLTRGVEGERSALIEDAMRLVKSLEGQGVRSRPVLDAVVRLGPKPGDEEHAENIDLVPTEAHTFPADLITIRSALRAGEIPVLPPLALDSFCRSTPVDANDVLAALARGMVEAAALEDADEKEAPHGDLGITRDVDLTPLRLMIINREGGVPSYARNGKPHLLINLSSEYDHIHDTFHEPWKQSNPSALSNLSLARKCLSYMPPTSSAIMVSHRSPSSLIANLITNKPALSSSLPHALLQGKSELAPHTPTLLRRGVPVHVLRTLDEIDRPKMNNLLEKSFGRKLDEEAFYQRLEHSLDFAIVAGDYAGAAIVTNETCPGSSSLSYLDKFAVLPSHQGDGTVDFLWVALHDESYGLGLSYSVNPNGGKEGKGEARDLVWRSRSNNPINKWYFERSTGHVRLGPWVLFWCDAEKRLKTEEGRRLGTGLSYVEDWEAGRLTSWADTALKVPSSWK